MQMCRIHAIHRFVQRSTDHQASIGNSTVVLIHFQTLHVAAVVGLSRKRRVGRPRQAQYRARLFDCAIGTQQLGADDTHLWALSMVEQCLQPVRLHDDRIAVQQHQIVATSVAHS
ncbi:hypothetical protein D3C72_1035360 [compost metagenome]